MSNAKALGYVNKGEDGNYEGVLAMGFRGRIRIDANLDKSNERQPDFRIFAERLGDIGAGWTKIGKTSGNPYLSLSVAHPVICQREVYAKLGRKADGEDHEFVILWNPEE